MYIYTNPYRRNNHDWTYEEDYICVEMYLKWLYRKDYLGQSVDSFVNLVYSRIPEVKKSSIRMKMQNIQYLVDKYCPSLGRAIAPLDQYTGQCLYAFIDFVNKNKPKGVGPNVNEQPKPISYKNVKHDKYGKGEVIDLKRNRITIKFRKYNEEKIVTFSYPVIFESGLLDIYMNGLIVTSPMALKKLEEEFGLTK